MKVALIFILTVFSLSAFAFPETECDGRLGNRRVTVSVERGFPNSNWRRVDVAVEENGQVQRDTFNASVYSPPRFNRVRMSARNFNLEIDFWPDQRPQWGRTYRGHVATALTQNQAVSLYCRYQ